MKNSAVCSGPFHSATSGSNLLPASQAMETKGGVHNMTLAQRFVLSPFPVKPQRHVTYHPSVHNLIYHQLVGNDWHPRVELT